MPDTNRTRIEIIFKYIEWDNLTDAQYDLVSSFQEQFDKGWNLSDRQFEILEDIYDRAASQAEWGRWEARDSEV